MFALVLALIGSLITPTTEELSGYNFNEEKEVTTIKFRTYKNLIIIPARLNDTIQLSLILDTGTRSLILFERKCGKIGNLYRDRKIRIHGRGSMDLADAGFSFPNKITIGDITGIGVGAAVLKESELSRAMPQVDGIIGYELFVRFCIQIDYAAQTITLHNRVPENTLQSFRSLRFTLVDQHPIINSVIQTSRKKKITVSTLIDTGSSMGLMVFTNQKENFQIQDVEMEIGTGLAGRVTGFLVGIPSCQLGDLKIFPENSKLVVTGGNPEDKLFKVSASLGGGFLKDYVVMFSYATSQLFIKNKRDI